MCVQSKCKATFLVYSSLIITERPKLSTTKIVYSKQRGGCFSVYSSLMSIVQLNVLLQKNGCSKRVGACCLFYSSINIVRLKCVTANFTKLP